MQGKLKFKSMGSLEPIDLATMQLLDHLELIKERVKTDNFNLWLGKCNDNGVPNSNFIRWFIQEIKLVLKECKYEITDGKRFKDEMATFIYKLSDH